MASYDYSIIEKIQCSKKQICSKNKIDKRDYLDFTLNSNGNKKLLVIMMNPSIADNNISDKSINKIIQYFKNGHSNKNNDIKYVSVVNLFPIYCKKSGELYSIVDKIIKLENGNDIINKIISNNRKILESKILENNFIVLGWGNCPDNFNQTSFFREVVNVIDLLIKNNKIENIFIFNVKNNRHFSENGLTKENNPIHLSNGSIIGLLKIKIDNLYKLEIIEGNI